MGLAELACGGSEERGRMGHHGTVDRLCKGWGGSGNGPIPMKEQKLGSVVEMGLCPYVHLNLHMEKPIFSC